MAVVKYQCKNCGDNLNYDADSGMLKCDSCGSTFEIEKLKKDKSANSARKSKSSGKKRETELKGDFVCPECFEPMKYDENSFQLNCRGCGFKQGLANYKQPKNIPTKAETAKPISSGSIVGGATKKGGSKQYVCPCGKKLTPDSDGNFKCSSCGSNFVASAASALEKEDADTDSSFVCPSCGNDEMDYNDKTSNLTCTACGQSIGAYEYGSHGEEKYSHEGFEKIEERTSVSSYDEEIAREYHCENCGAVLVTESNTAATTCGFCHSPMILSDRLSGSYAPAQAIPFKMDMKKAHEEFKKWCKGGIITPNDFRMLERVKDIQGIYVPFWLYDLNVQASGEAYCTRVSVSRSGDTQITRTSHYKVYRSVVSDYYKLPADAAEKMPDEYMDMLEPFNYDELKSFNMAYLTGYAAQKYDYTDKDLLPRITERVTKYISSYLRSTITGYNSVVMKSVDANAVQRDAVYTLLPVYLMNYRYKDKTYTFVMNGQTGKVAGKPPISKPKLVGLFVATASVSFGIFKLIGTLAGLL